MKKVLIPILLSVCVASCSTWENNVINTDKGKIIRVEKAENDSTLVEVELKDVTNNMHPVDYWFIGSDTNRVGQLIYLKVK